MPSAVEADEVAHPTIAPTILGRYELLCEVGRGGMATVHLARARAEGGFARIVAVKVCHPALTGTDFAERFLDEARLAAQVHHPNVVPTLDVALRPVPFLVMEYVDGEPLAEVLRLVARRPGRMPAPIALRVALDLLRGLHAVHELRDARGQRMDAVHRDVSPQNVMLGVDGVARVMDFGIAKAATRAVVTRDGSARGKLGYMAPEQISAQVPVTRRADVFAAGVVLWEALSGRRLFHGSTDPETVARVMQPVVAPLAAEVPGTNAAVDAAMARALDADPVRRFPSAELFAMALETAGVAIASTQDVARFVESATRDARDVRRAALARALDRADTLDDRTPDTAPSLPPPTGVRPRVARSRRTVLIALALLASIALAVIAHALHRDPVSPPAMARATVVASGPRATVEPPAVLPAPVPVIAPRLTPVPVAAPTPVPRVASGVAGHSHRRRHTVQPVARAHGSMSHDPHARETFQPPGI